MVVFETEQDILRHLEDLGDLPTEPYVILISESYLSRFGVARVLSGTDYRVDWKYPSQRISDDDPWIISAGIRHVGLEDLVRGDI